MLFNSVFWQEYVYKLLWKCLFAYASTTLQKKCRLFEKQPWITYDLSPILFIPCHYLIFAAAGLCENSMLSGRDRLVCTVRCGYVHWDNRIPVEALLSSMPMTAILIKTKGGRPNGSDSWVVFWRKENRPMKRFYAKWRKNWVGRWNDRTIGSALFFQRNELIIAYHVRATGEIIMDEDEAYKIVPIHKLRPWPFGTGVANGWRKEICKSTLKQQMSLAITTTTLPGLFGFSRFMGLDNLLKGITPVLSRLLIALIRPIL